MKELYSAFIKFQGEFKGLKPDADNPFFKSNYISLDGILETVRPLLVKQGLAVIQNAFAVENGSMAVKTLLIHESGQSIESEVMTMKPTKDDPQQRGSVVTYMKRYQLGALLGICESLDDDANMATFGSSKPNNGSQSKPKTQANTTTPPIQNKPPQTAQSSADKCSDCGSTINQAVATFSTKKFGKALCMDCQNKAKGA